MPARLLILLLSFSLLAGCGEKSGGNRIPATSPGDTLPVHAGGTISPEGSLGAGEWRDADTVLIKVSESVGVTALVKHDTENLLVRFSNVQSKTAEYFPILLIDPDNSKDSIWDESDRMLEVNYQDCEAMGDPDSLRCGLLRKGWFANNFPTVAPGVIEIKISAAHIGIDLAAGDTIGLALGLRLPDSTLVFWPASARVVSPASWGTATLVAN